MLLLTPWWMHFVSGRMNFMDDVSEIPPIELKVIEIEVIYISPEMQVIKSLEVPLGCSVGAAIELSCIGDDFPEVDLGILKVGIFGRIVKRAEILQAQDRVEIYRSLVVDPKEARRRRAKANK